MNRQMKRQLQRQGQIQADGSPALQRRQPPTPRPTGQPGVPRRERKAPTEFVREVRGELRKVAWPTRPEVVNYSTVVLFTLVVLIALIFVLDYAFQKAVLFIFKA